jgi:periplasmic divalent cation tolerance protein
MIIIYTVCKNYQEAKKIANMLVKLRLVACANFWPIESVYHWQNKVVNGKEAVLLFKTRKNYYKRIESIIKKIHGYDVPCIFQIEVNKVNRQYLDWLMKETRIV